MEDELMVREGANNLIILVSLSATYILTNLLFLLHFIASSSG